MKHNDNSTFYYYIQFTPNLPTITLSNNGSYTPCKGSTNATMTASGASSYVWSNNLAVSGNGNATATIPTATAGDAQYTVTGTASNGCTATATAYVSVKPLPDVKINNQTSGNLSECASLTLTATGAATNNDYSWSNGTTSTNTITVTQSGNYTVTGTNSYGCTASATANVTINPLPTVTISGPTTACSTDNPTLTADGAVSYSWNDQSTNATLPVTVPGGTYTVIGTDANGCTGTATHTITVNQSPTITITGNTALCSGNSTTLTATSDPTGATYEWNDHSTNASLPVSAGGSYSVTGTLNGCSSNAQVTVTVSTTPTAPALTGGTRCGDGQVNLSVNNPDNNLTYNWYLTENTNEILHTGTTYAPSVSATTTYYVSAQNAQGCSSARASVTATVNRNNDQLATTPVTNCGPATVTLTASGNSNGTTLAWYSDANGDTAVANTAGINVTQTTTYYVASIDGNSCRSTLVPMTVTIHDVPNAPVPAQTEYCKASDVTLPLTATTDNGTTLTWIAPNGNTVNVSVNNASVGTYRVFAVSSDNCHSDTANVTVTAFPAVPAANDVTLCAPGSATLSVNNPTDGITYTWYADANHNNTAGTGSSISVDATAN
ncbi:MAG: hypothetical protein J5730_01365, partial [Bacteroidales bacterium]|nr:hypothetical protein [Bacteroidales bacterium]